jgi:hypothetical protein
MCTSILLRDLFSEPAHCGWHAGNGEDQHNPNLQTTQTQAGRGILQAKGIAFKAL